MLASNRAYKWLILPIETKVRELDGKVLLGAAAAERGWGVVFGQTETIVADTAGLRGVVLEKDGYFGNPRIGPFLEAGKRVCALDEEGLVYLSSRDYYRRRLDRMNLHRLALVFVWGQNQKHDILEHVQDVQGKLVLTGHPRFDLLRSELRGFYAAEARRLKDRHGPFVLVNTNFADSNHFMGSDWVIENLRNNRYIRSPLHEADERAFMRYQRGILEHFTIMVARVAEAFPHLTIIVRPHPSEDHEAWRAAVQNLKNVEVIHEGDVNPWLLAAEVAIHNSCMTGIQGFLLEKPTIAFVPVRSEQFDYFLPNALSLEAGTPAEIISLIRRVLDNPEAADWSDRAVKLGIARRYIESISGSLAADRIVDALDKLKIAPSVYAPASAVPDLRTRYARGIRRLESIAGSAMRRLTAPTPKPRFTPTDPRYIAYTRQKYPGLSTEEVESKLSQLQQATGRFGNLQVHTLGGQALCILPR